MSALTVQSPCLERESGSHLDHIDAGSPRNIGLARARVATVEDGVVEKPYEYPDLDTALRASRSAGLTPLAEQTAGDAAVSDAIASALAPYRTPSGGYRLKVESRYILATAE